MDLILHIRAEEMLLSGESEVTNWCDAAQSRTAFDAASTPVLANTLVRVWTVAI